MRERPRPESEVNDGLRPAKSRSDAELQWGRYELGMQPDSIAYGPAVSSAQRQPAELLRINALHVPPVPLPQARTSVRPRHGGVIEWRMHHTGTSAVSVDLKQ